MADVLQEFFSQYTSQEDQNVVEEVITQEKLKKRYLKSNAKTNLNWPMDSADGKLSYSKMVYEWNERHFVKREEDDKKGGFRKGYSCCLSTGWLNCKKPKSIAIMDEDQSV